MDEAQESLEAYYRRLAAQQGIEPAAARIAEQGLEELGLADEAIRDDRPAQARQQLGRIRRRLSALRAVLDNSSGGGNTTS